MKIYFHKYDSEYQKQCESWISDWNSEKKEFVVQTSGSTGTPKTILLQRAQLQASAERSNEFFGINENSRILLPLSPKTIGAKMLLIRALIANSELHVVTPAAAVFESLPTDLNFDFASLVPLQLIQLAAENQLDRIDTILLGGAPMPLDLENSIAAKKKNIFYGFGMTETVSHIALRTLGDPIYQALQGVRFTENEGKLVIHDELLQINQMETNDLVELVDAYSFNWLGRADFTINSGGIKVHPEMIERETGHFFQHPFLISSSPDVTYGEKVILVTEELLSKENWQRFKEHVERLFGKYAVPKEQIQAAIPINAAGKPDRMKLKQYIGKHL